MKLFFPVIPNSFRDLSMKVVLLLLMLSSCDVLYAQTIRNERQINEKVIVNRHLKDTTLTWDKTSQAFKDSVASTGGGAAHTGDVTGTTALTVVGLRGKPITAEAPTDNYVPKYDAALDTIKWEPDAGGGDSTWAKITVDSVQGSSGTNLVIEAQNIILRDADEAGEAGIQISTAGNIMTFNATNSELRIQNSGNDLQLSSGNDLYLIGGSGTIQVQGNITTNGTIDGIDVATEVAANNAKTTNATHTGDAIGATALAVVALRGKPITVEAPTDNYLLKYDAALDTIKWEPDATGAGGSAYADSVNMNPLPEVTVATGADTIIVLDVTDGKYKKAVFPTPAGGGDMVTTNNLSDVASAPTSVTNLGFTETATAISSTVTRDSTWDDVVVNDTLNALTVIVNGVLTVPSNIDRAGDLNIIATGADVGIGNAGSTNPQNLHIYDGGADDEPGVLVLYQDDGGTTYIFSRTNGNLAVHSAFPSDDDASGSDILTELTGAPIASPTFTGVVTFPTPFTLGAISVTTTGPQLNALPFVLDDTTNFQTAYTHSQDNTQAHTDYLLNSGGDIGVGSYIFDGLTLGANENLTLGAETLDHDASTFVFSDDVVIPDEAYGAPWNGSLEVPTKNALYDKIETLGVAAGDSDYFKITVDTLAGKTGNLTILEDTLRLGSTGIIDGISDLTTLDTLDAAQVIGDTVTVTDLLVMGSAEITPTELGYVDGLTSDAQTQINTKKADVNYSTFYTQLDSSVLIAVDTVGIGFAHQSFVLDSVVVITYGPTPNFTFQIVNGSTNVFSGNQTKSASGTTAYTTFSDGAFEAKSDIYIHFPTVTTQPKIVKVILIGK